MNQPFLVTGGSGTLGHAVVARLLAAGCAVRAFSRRPRPAGAPAAVEWVGGELRSGDGLADAVAGVGVIVHCAGDPRRPRVDVDGTRNLLQAVGAAGTPHLVYISIGRCSPSPAGRTLVAGPHRRGPTPTIPPGLVGLRRRDLAV